MKISITHNKKLIYLLNLLIKCVSVRLEPQILSIKVEWILLFLRFLIIDFCNYSANSWFEILSFLIAPPEAYLSRVAKVSDCASEADFLSKNL